ncbi:ATP-dependent helicase HepA [Serratia fonticola]|uniref:DEAD/DEAH box helicase n=1 Tax=Serratia fonticola TaxID=47917 RepID=UPI00217AA6C3|nr:DEAD/DEAH box helicase [Serratia fonticola]CAI1077777.1 ATP-dependent helicase HepA [Serratia fonticola]
MATKLKQSITPVEVSDEMNFDLTDANWHYKAGETSMAAKQAEGVAGLWNLLSKHQLALLADEVGMGKTYQAMGLMLLLWQAKPDARILVMAPNCTLCNNWRKEFATFIQQHYRAENNPFVSEEGERKYAPQIHVRLAELAAAVEEKKHHFYLITTYSLSGLVPQAEKEDALNAAGTYGKLYRRQIKQALGKGGFDLIIIDEAHYFRNRKGSQRAAAAQAFFGDKQDRLGSNVLLLTATPNHSSPRNIFNILSYFSDLPNRYAKDDVSALMSDFAIRRLRHMQGREGYHSKYEYRHERASVSNFTDRMDAELFFALYQKQLVVQLDKEKKSGGGRRMLYGYLEGFESTGGTASQRDNGDDEDEKIHNDFNQAPDSYLLNKLTQQFHDIYHRFPDHPKYDTLVDACIASDPFEQLQPLHSRKHLVFVRRIPSVREITQRINARYDEMMAERLMNAWQLPVEALVKWRESGWARDTFVKLLSGKSTREPDPEELMPEEGLADEPEEDNDLKLSSKIAELFVTKKTGLRRTDCANVSLRFRRPESLFSLFLEPALDGTTGIYHYHYRKKSGERQRDSYGDAACDARMQKLPSVEMIKYTNPLPTAWGLMFHKLPQQSKEQLIKWRDEPDGMAIIENFANYLRTGYLFASPVMIELYCWFTEFSRESQKSEVQQRYQHFIEWVTPKLKRSLMLRYFAAAIETFETLCVKIVGQKLDNNQHNWHEFTSLNSPGWFASGQSRNRERLIRGFNSPFFPDVLVATSVLQEGVNLHLQCHQVHHYGIAWTPGDNEQRNGRIDRLFGCINTLLKAQGEAEMVINYPYLEGTFDQDQLASFIRNKHSVEEKLDSCESSSFDSVIDLQENTQGWQQWLRQPSKDKAIADPYPAKFKPRD